MKNVPAIILIAILWIAFGAAPIAFSCPPMPTEAWFKAHPYSQFLGMDVLITALAAVVLLILKADSGSDREKVIRYCGFALLAVLLTDIHYDMVDRFHMNWQIAQFNDILMHHCLPPDQYRFLPQGTLWWMTLITGDFQFAYMIFRFFFTFLLCHAIYRLARLYLPSAQSVLIVFIYGCFYTLSTRYYFGNLLDPMSHLVMLTALYYCRQRRFCSFFWLFVLGVFIKETMLLLAPCYYLMNPENARLRAQQNLQRMFLLGAAGIAVFFACRLPFHFNFNFQSLNRTPESMIYANLGIGHARVGSPVSIYMRYVHPILFLFMWLPVIVWGRRRLPVSLFWTSLYLAATLYITNTLFGWNYESRNFVPGLIVLLIATLAVLVDWVAEKPMPTAR
ncbi:MAG TPA: hypothetical protein VK815_01825 [Candidatus Acidoferrales bacterium]|nr:hypothetical protein [Candidatus Acidoferrales bacterium]